MSYFTDAPVDPVLASLTMDFSSSPIAGSSRSSSPVPSPTRTDTELPHDVDESFNSSMSISDSPYMSPSNGRSMRAALPALVFTAPNASLASKATSPAVPKRPDPVPIQRARAFGRERSLNANMGTGMGAGQGMMLPPPVPAKRAGLPTDWTGDGVFHGSLPSPRSDKMDIDSPAPSRKNSFASSLSGSLSGSPGLGSFFCESPNPPALPTSKRRSLVTDSPASPSGSPTAKRTSLGGAREKAVSSGVMLFGSSIARTNSIAGRRAPPYKRPAIAPVPGNGTAADSRSPSFASADAVLYPSKPTGNSLNAFPRAAPAPMRRAYSVCDQPTMPDLSEDESEYENSPSAAALHAKQVKMARKAGRSRLGGGMGMGEAVDGSPGYKPARSSIAVPSASPSKMRSGTAGMPGFGDNEMDGKILPCHKVKEDGLVRITPNTLGDLLQGKYSSQITRYHVIDCRFDYEYSGGHVEGAVNLKSVEALDELLLSEAQGLYGQGNSLPTPSKGDEAEGKVVLVFHCEFSAKRAPTFAKELRRRDRTLNSAVYPKIYYPELYILEGGYCGFYQSQPDLCEPKGYIRMDDPQHLKSRDSDLHHFRSSNFSRTRSFTYGESQPLAARGAPLCPPLAFAAGSIAQNRRQGLTINEEEEHSPSAASTSGSDLDVDTSPCPRVCSMGSQPIFGSAKTRTLGRMGAFSRTASYAGAVPQRAPLRS